MSLIQLYDNILAEFKEKGVDELVSVNYTETFSNPDIMQEDGYALFAYARNDALTKRRNSEMHFYNYLEHQLFSHLQEIKFYSTVNINDTRRLVSSSSDCISAIQILVRDEIHLNVYFRSSDFDGALPADIEWLTSLPAGLIAHLFTMINEKSYGEVTIDLLEELAIKNVKLNLMFGSLHRTQNG